MKAKATPIDLLPWCLAGAFFLWAVTGFSLCGSIFLCFFLFDPLVWPLVKPLGYLNDVINAWSPPEDLRAAIQNEVQFIGMAIITLSGTLWHWFVGKVVSELYKWIYASESVESHN